MRKFFDFICVIKRMKKYLICGLISIGFIIHLSCKKNTLFTSNAARLNFSADTLSFDTIFTTIGSTTAYFKVYNRYNQKVKIAHIYLENTTSSVFFMNVDGDPGASFNNVELAANDSLYVFFACKPNANMQNSPLIISENVVFEINGNLQKVNIEAYGQDAYFHKYEEIQTSLWKNDKPHVLLGSCLIDTGQTLTIEKGARIYCHPGSYLLVSGTLKSIGTKSDSILFRGDRLERYYDELPGQWGGIVFLRNCGIGSKFEHAIIKNATTAIVLGSTYANKPNYTLSAADFLFSSAPEITINKCKIYNCEQNGIFTFFSKLHVENTLIYNCNKECVSLLYGGLSDFKHCTLANFSSNEIDHKDPILRISNYALFNGQGNLSEVNATFNNCIIIGNVANKGDKFANNFEVFIDHDLGFNASAPFNYTFDHCLLQLEPTLIDQSRLINCSTNPSDLNAIFKNKEQTNFHLTANSPALNLGSNNVGTIDDLDDKSRNSPPDVGSYEY